MQEFQSTRIFFAKGYAPNWSEEVFVISKVKLKIPYHAHTLLVISTVKKMV